MRTSRRHLLGIGIGFAGSAALLAACGQAPLTDASPSRRSISLWQYLGIHFQPSLTPRFGGGRSLPPTSHSHSLSQFPELALS